MTDYNPPLRDIRFVLDHVVDFAKVAALPGFEDATPDTVDSILTEAGKIAAGTIAPLNRVGDAQGAKLVDGVVRTAEGWKAAWDTLIEGGWNSLACAQDFGGMGLPNLLNTAVQEMWQTANMAFALNPMLTQGAIGAIEKYASDALKETYLPKMVTGEWTGAMNLTEPQAGSDLAAVRTKAVPEGDAYRISGQKIFITYGDHDLTDNIVHLVLARLPDAPAGVKGISLFLVSKMLVDADGTITGPNDVVCASLEHKLGIHGSPTAVMAFGEKEGALGYLIGEPNRGLEYMFAMMNHARLNVGMQGLAIAERAYQLAVSYARERVQGKPSGWTEAKNPPIIEHPDVRRQLMSMKSRIEAMRGILYAAAAAIDISHHAADPAERKAADLLVELLTPVAKGWCTETGVDIASLGVQVHGGMGYVEETGAAQHYRDARITTIYEGTTAIQANDLVLRKLVRNKGVDLTAFIAQIAADADALAASPDALLSGIGQGLGNAAAIFGAAKDLILANAGDARMPAAAATPFLMLAGVVIGGWRLALAAQAAAALVAKGEDHDGFYAAKLPLTAFYIDNILPQADGYAAAVAGSGAVMAIKADLL